MPVRTLLLLSAAVLASAPALAADAPKRIPERAPALDLTAMPMPAASADENALAQPTRKGKRVRYTFPAPRRVM
jgi:hypothetical protein